MLILGLLGCIHKAVLEAMTFSVYDILNFDAWWLHIFFFCVTLTLLLDSPAATSRLTRWHSDIRDASSEVCQIASRLHTAARDSTRLCHGTGPPGC
jgi:hypothetical protein